jgi:hypothetical protein
MYHRIDQGCQVQSPMSDIFFYSYVYVYYKIAAAKRPTPTPPVAVMRLSRNINRRHPPNETDSQKIGGGFIETGTQYQLRIILNKRQMFHVELFYFPHKGGIRGVDIE